MKEKNISDIVSGRWNWYGLGEEEQEDMIQFDEMIHTYQLDNRKAEVGILKEKGAFGIRMWENNVHQKDELFEGYSETYAENAAENYVFGIKN
tara:strand:+ start:217 stop:495 length:279 start_codon:yes stop_codon:yes gene_type:complete